MAAEQAPSDIYAKLLLPKKHGYPLWLHDPDPSLPLAYRSIGVRIGDVGTITYDGGFDFLFNICHDANDPVNWLGVPDGFVPLTLEDEDVLRRPEMHDKGTHISSPRVSKVHPELSEDEYENVPYVSVWQQHLLTYLGTSGGFQFECTGSSGAVLVLPKGGSRVDLRKRGLFFNYAAYHGMEWYQFVNGRLARQVRNGSLYLVTGCDKSPAWGVASYSDPSGNTAASLKFKVVDPATDGAAPVYSWEDYNSITVRTGRQQVESNGVAPQPNEARANPTFNQCAFIRGYRISVQPRVLAILLGNRVEVEDGINPLHRVQKGGILSSFSSIFSNIFPNMSRSEASHSGLAWQYPDRKMDAGTDNIFIQSISDVSDVSLYFFRC